MLGHVTKGRYVSCKMFTIVHSRMEGGQNWIKFSPRSSWMTFFHYFFFLSENAYQIRRNIRFLRFTNTLIDMPSIWKSIFNLKHKSDNLQKNTLGRWNDCLIDQASDIPCNIFFHNFLQYSLQESFQYIFLIFL